MHSALFTVAHFPSFSEGLSLRADTRVWLGFAFCYFPSFSEGLSLRDAGEALPEPTRRISLPFRRDFH